MLGGLAIILYDEEANQIDVKYSQEGIGHGCMAGQGWRRDKQLKGADND
jgi:hypothetical protein